MTFDCYVIASVAKQSILGLLDCFVAYAPRNDESGSTPASAGAGSNVFALELFRARFSFHQSATGYRGAAHQADGSGTPNGQAPIAQLDRALPSEGRGHRFESCWVRHIFQWLRRNPPLAYLAESAPSQHQGEIRAVSAAGQDARLGRFAAGYLFFRWEQWERGNSRSKTADFRAFAVPTYAKGCFHLANRWEQTDQLRRGNVARNSASYHSRKG